MRWPQQPVGWVAVVVTAVAASACATHQPADVPLSGRLVKGASGPGGVPWPMADGVGSADPGDRAIPGDVADELAAGPRSKQETRDASMLEVSDDRLRAALELAAASPTASSLRAVADEYRRLRVFDQAHGYLSRALVLEPNDSGTRDSMARLWRDWGLPAEGLSEAYRAVAADPGSPEAQNTLGTLLFLIGHTEAATERFERVVALDARAAYARNNLCHAALALGDEARALSECLAALEIDPTLSAARNNLGLIHAAAGRWDEAATEFVRAAGDEAVGWYNLGVAYLSRREYELAADAFDRALALRPAFDEARERARQARRRAASEARVADRKQ